MISSVAVIAPVRVTGAAAEVYLNSTKPRPVLEHRDGASRTSTTRIAMAKEAGPMVVTLADQERDITYPGGEPQKVRDAYDRQQGGEKK